MVRCLLMLLAAMPWALAAQSNADIRNGFDRLAREHPKLVTIESMPVEGMFHVRIGPPGKRVPAVLLIGSPLGDEQSPAQACLELARAVLKDETTRAAFDTAELLLVPIPNPRGRAALLPGTLAALDDDRDGAADEDGPTDLNGDGRITQMRVRRAGGRYITHPDNPKLLIEAKPGEAGDFDLLWEGKDDDSDGRINEDPRGTVLLANDWSIRWDGAHPGANRFMMQLAETRALAEFVLARPQVITSVIVRSVGGEVRFAKGPPARGDKDTLARDKELAAVLGKSLGATDSAAALPASGPGSLLDWLYECAGSHACEIGLAALPRPPKTQDDKDKDSGGGGKKDEDGDGEDDPAETPDAPASAKGTPKGRSSTGDVDVAWAAHTPERLHDWKKFTHPQLGEVEIGGWEIEARRDSQPEAATAGTARLLELTKAALGALPILSVTKVEVENKGDGMYRVRLTLHNSGLLDYRSAFAEANTIGLPMFVQLEDSASISLVSGTRRQRAENLAGHGTVAFEWFVRVPDDATQLSFKLEAQRTGDFNHKIAVKDCAALKTDE